MGKKKVFIITIALLLVVGTGSFVFAGEGDQELDVDNRTNSGQQVTPVPKVETVETPVPVIKPSVPEEPTENDDNNSDNTNNSSTSRPGTSGNGSSSTTKPTTPSNKPDVEQPTTPSNPNDNNGNTGSENKPQKPDKPTSTLKVVSIETSNKNKFTFDPVSVTIKFNEPIKGVNEGGWTSKDNDLTRIKVNITKNDTYKIIAYDKNEIALEITYEVKNYHPMPDITTSIDENGTTKIIMKPNEDLGDIEGWTKEDDGTYTKILGDNEDLTDLNIGGEEIKIDYTKPELDVSSSNVENGTAMPTNKATITITSKTGNSLLLPNEEWYYVNEEHTIIAKDVNSNVSGVIEVLDTKGNKISVDYKIENVYSVVLKIKNPKGTIVNQKIEVTFLTNSQLKEAPKGWTAVDISMQKMKRTFEVDETVPVVLVDLWGNEGYFYVTASINSSGRAVITSRAATEDEIIKLKEQYNLN